jgi:hypothetical protein
VVTERSDSVIIHSLSPAFVHLLHSAIRNSTADVVVAHVSFLAERIEAPNEIRVFRNREIERLNEAVVEAVPGGPGIRRPRARRSPPATLHCTASRKAWRPAANSIARCGVFNRLFEPQTDDRFAPLLHFANSLLPFSDC